MIDPASLLLDYPLLGNIGPLITENSRTKDRSSNIIGSVLQSTQVETTSFDGKPFLTPTEYGVLFTIEKIGTNPFGDITNLNNANYIKRIEAENSLSKRPFSALGYNQNTVANVYNENGQDFDVIQKKQKINPDHKRLFVEENDYSSDRVSDATTPSTLRKSSSILSSDLFSDQFSRDSYTETDEGSFSKGDRPEKITQYFYDLKSHDLVFEIEWKSKGKKTYRKNSLVTREELLKHDPLFLLYFYEGRLEFTKHPNFDCKKLKKPQVKKAC